MSNRITRGTALAGRYQAELPGHAITGPAYRFTAVTSTAEVNTGYVFNTNQVVTDILVNITAVAATSQTLSVGILAPSSSSAPTAFLNALPIGLTGLKTGTVTTATSGGLAFEYYVSTTYGSYLAQLTAGGTSGGSGTFVKTPYVIGTVPSSSGSVTYRNLSFTPGTSVSITGSITPIFYEIVP